MIELGPRRSCSSSSITAPLTKLMARKKKERGTITVSAGASEEPRKNFVDTSSSSRDSPLFLAFLGWQQQQFYTVIHASAIDIKVRQNAF